MIGHSGEIEAQQMTTSQTTGGITRVAYRQGGDAGAAQHQRKVSAGGSTTITSTRVVYGQGQASEQ